MIEDWKYRFSYFFPAGATGMCVMIEYTSWGLNDFSRKSAFDPFFPSSFVLCVLFISRKLALVLSDASVYDSRSCSSLLALYLTRLTHTWWQTRSYASVLANIDFSVIFFLLLFLFLRFFLSSPSFHPQHSFFILLKRSLTIDGCESRISTTACREIWSKARNTNQKKRKHENEMNISSISSFGGNSFCLLKTSSYLTELTRIISSALPNILLFGSQFAVVYSLFFLLQRFVYAECWCLNRPNSPPHSLPASGESIREFSNITK